jgi:hypothetical protein
LFLVPEPEEQVEASGDHNAHNAGKNQRIIDHTPGMIPKVAKADELPFVCNVLNFVMANI